LELLRISNFTAYLCSHRRTVRQLGKFSTISRKGRPKMVPADATSAANGTSRGRSVGVPYPGVHGNALSSALPSRCGVLTYTQCHGAGDSKQGRMPRRIATKPYDDGRPPSPFAAYSRSSPRPNSRQVRHCRSGTARCGTRGGRNTLRRTRWGCRLPCVRHGGPCTAFRPDSLRRMGAGRQLLRWTCTSNSAG